MELKQLNDKFGELFMLDDENILPILAAMIILAKTNLQHVWFFLIGGASGGKTTLLSCFNKVPFLTMVSDLTPNTLLSGAQSNDHETSLLKKLGENFVVVMKDFTTILSKSSESQDMIMAQLREVYDGYITKYTGLGKEISWGTKEDPKRSVFIMASTESIYKVQEKFSEMGSRGLNYVLKEPNTHKRKEITRMSIKKAKGFNEKMNEIQDFFRDYVLDMVNNLPLEYPDLDDEFIDQIVDVSELSTRARSIVLRDYKGKKNLALSPEAPMRVAKQLMALGQVLTVMNGGVLTPELKKSILKCGFDCVPKQIGMAMKICAAYEKVQTAGVSKEVSYSPSIVAEWLDNLNMFQILDKKNINGDWWWVMKEEYRKLLQDHLGVEYTGMELMADMEDEMLLDTELGGNYQDVLI
jgi:predicted ATPase